MIDFKYTGRALGVLALLAGSLTAAEIGGVNRVIVIHTPEGGQPAEAWLGSEGSIHLVYNSVADGIPYYVKSSNHGASFSSPLALVDEASRKPGLVYSADAMALGKQDAVYVGMSTNNWKLKLSGVPEGMVFTTLAPGAREFAPVRSLNNLPSEGFSLAADQKGEVVATWLANKLYVNYSHDGGRTFTPNAEINPAYSPCECCTTRAVFGSGGDVAVLYRERTNDERDMHVVILKKGGRQLRTRISSTLWKINACPMTYYNLSATPNGYVAAWPTRGDIYFARLDTEGKVLPPGEIKTPGRTGMRTGLVALGASDGTSLIAWKKDDQLYWQAYDPAGRPEGSPNSMPGPGKGTAGLVEPSGKFILFQ